MKLNMKINPSPSCGILNFAEKKLRWLSSLWQSVTFLGRSGIKVNDLKLAVLIIASLFILGQAFLTLAENNTNPGSLFLDSDQDGLSDQEEKTYGTDPNNADTDGDGYTDGAEVKSGYDPLKPSPGDKLETASTEEPSETVSAFDGKINLTRKLSEQLTTEMGLGGNDGETPAKEITTENIKALAQDFLDTNSPAQTSVKLSIDDLEIQRQDYSGLSAEDDRQKKAEDFTNYAISVFYILSLHSEKPILSTYDFDNALSETLREISTAMLNSDLNYFDNLDNKTQEILDEMKDVEVPEEFATTHVKMINMIAHGLSLKDSITPNKDDPTADMINFSKITAFLDTFSNFLTEFTDKTNQYEMDNNFVKNKLGELGIDTSGSDTAE